MLYVLIGDDSLNKKKFIEEQKNKLSVGLWGKEVESFHAQEITSIAQLESLLRFSSLAGERLVVLWEIDKLRKSLQERFVSLVESYVVDFSQLILIVEGSGERGSFSCFLAERFDRHSLLLGEVKAKTTFFDLAKKMISGDTEWTLRLFNELEIDKFSFSQFLGALRVVITEKLRDDRLKMQLLDILLEADLAVKIDGESVRNKFLDLMYRIKFAISARSM